MAQSSAATISPVTRPRSNTRRIIHWLLHSSVLIKAQVIGIVVLLGSCLQALDVLPQDSIFSNKYNPANVYLVKLSWFWTVLWLIVTVTLTGTLYSAFKFRDILRHLGRVAVGHVIWFTCTFLLANMHKYTGWCAVEGIDDFGVCIRSGHKWNGFDPSGHVFLLTYCVFIITEEAANIKLEVWNEFNGTLPLERRALSKQPHLTNWLKRLHAFGSYYTEALELYGIALLVVWVFMVTTTSLFFHTFLEKLLGYVLAVLSWYVSYRVTYGKCPYVPCKPSHGLLNPMKYLKMPSS